jgi:glycosyltransferase involved in cell wall biosynthesis
MHSSPGKGAAVKVGMLAAQGDYRFICDADLAMPIAEIAKFLPPTQAAGTFDIAIASRELPGAVRYDEPVYRHIMGRVFNWLVRVLAVPGIQDTQCGFKMFTREAAQSLFPAATHRRLGLRCRGALHCATTWDAADRGADQLVLPKRQPRAPDPRHDQHGARTAQDSA